LLKKLGCAQYIFSSFSEAGFNIIQYIIFISSHFLNKCPPQFKSGAKKSFATE
jgi:hypothetical protein